MKAPDLIINNVILPDNIDEIKIGDTFTIKFEILNLYKREVDIELECWIQFATKDDERGDDERGIIYLSNNLKYLWALIDSRTILQTQPIKKLADEFDIKSELYEEQWYGLKRKLMWECSTRHKKRIETIKIDNIDDGQDKETPTLFPTDLSKSFDKSYPIRQDSIKSE